MSTMTTDDIIEEVDDEVDDGEEYPNVRVLSDEEFKAWADELVANSGFTYDELREQAKESYYETCEARFAWWVASHWYETLQYMTDTD